MTGPAGPTSPAGSAAPASCCADAHLRHCHATYVWHGGHDDGECTDPDCAVPPEGHALALRCDEVTPSCRCVASP